MHTIKILKVLCFYRIRKQRATFTKIVTRLKNARHQLQIHFQ